MAKLVILLAVVLIIQESYQSTGTVKDARSCIDTAWKRAMVASKIFQREINSCGAKDLDFESIVKSYDYRAVKIQTNVTGGFYKCMTHDKQVTEEDWEAVAYTSGKNIMCKTKYIINLSLDIEPLKEYYVNYTP